MELSEHIRMNITAEILPTNFENVIIENNEIVSIRCNLKSMDDIKEWIKEFGYSTNTKWNCRKSCPSGERFVCWKKFVCHHSSFNKVPVTMNKKGNSKNADCLASITVKIKLNTTRMRREDALLKRGLTGVVTIIPFHKHSLTTDETLRFLPAGDCREQFEEYFSDGMGPTEAAKHHEEILKTNSDLQPSDFANSRINPSQRTIGYWYEKWRVLHRGSRNGPGVIDKLKDSTNQIPNLALGEDTSSTDFGVDACDIPNSESLEETPSTSKSLHATVSQSTDNNIPSCSDKNLRKRELRGKLKKLFTDGLEKFNSSEKVLEKAVRRLEKITSEGQWERMLATLGNNVPFKRKT